MIRFSVQAIALFALTCIKAAFAHEVDWTPESIDVRAGQGQEIELLVQLSSNRDYEALEVRVVPALKDHIQVSPSVISLQKGVTSEVVVTISPSDTAAPRHLDGVIQLRSPGQSVKKGKPKKGRTIPSSLKVSLEVFRAFRNEDSGYFVEPPTNWVEPVFRSSTFVDKDIQSSGTILPAMDAIAGLTINVLVGSREDYINSIREGLPEVHSYSHQSPERDWWVFEFYRPESGGITYSAFAEIFGRNYQVVVNDNIMGLTSFLKTLDSLVWEAQP